MNLADRFLKFILYRLGLYIYLLALVAAGALTLYILPAAEILSGLTALTETTALASVVSIAQWILSDAIFKYAVLFIVTAPFPLSFLFSLLFSGAFGSFASGMEAAADFPAKPGIGFWSGYKLLFTRVLLTAFVSFVAALSMCLVWTITAVPLAIIKALEVRGALKPLVFNVTLAVTALAAYAGLLFLRAFPMAVIPSLYSRSDAPLRDAFSFAGHYFFRVSKYFIISDIIMFFLITLYVFFNNPIYLLIFNCVIFSALVFFLLFVMFDTFSSGRYGLENTDAR